MQVKKGGKIVTVCPYCGYDEFEVELIYSGRGGFLYRFDGAETDNGQMHEGINYRELKTAYCGQCKKKIGRAQEATE